MKIIDFHMHPFLNDTDCGTCFIIACLGKSGMVSQFRRKSPKEAKNLGLDGKPTKSFCFAVLVCLSFTLLLGSYFVLWNLAKLPIGFFPRRFCHQVSSHQDTVLPML